MIEHTDRQTDFRNECKIWDFEFATRCAVAFVAAVAAVVALNFEQYRLRSTK